jgi:hypothetical protein
MNISKYISIPVFITSLALGLLFVYLLGEESKIVYIYPTLENVDKIQYADKSNTCFKYNANEVTCPTNKTLIKTIPIQ